MTVEVFKTNVQKECDKDYVINVIQAQFPDYKINFDLEDCDKILRIEGVELKPENIVKYVNHLGYICVPLE
ncbi:hypothetical protein [Flavobacterium piscis]|uniref:Copper chaperone n=1 Tax=Flavobacterium piscis TaxID=1114874 RepID=A0ABU1Y5T7_9FLAO|nr:hypothetical protein [Flavobacterium piscis]MDR7209418.1 hypothetical protein [Flavobacterium piscis]